MTTETRPEPPVPESAYADYEQDLLNDDLPPAQARATRRALERVVDRLMLVLATKTETRDEFTALRAETRDEFTALRTEMREEFARLWEQIAQLREDMAAVKAELRLLKWMFAVGGSAIIGLMTAIIVVLLSRL